MASESAEMRTHLTKTVDKKGVSSFFCFPAGFTCCKEHLETHTVEEYGVAFGIEHREELSMHNESDNRIKCPSWTQATKMRGVGHVGAFPSFAELENGGAITSPPRTAEEEELPLVDFAGSWLCVGIDGDMDKFLSDMGLGVAQLAEARTDMWGVKRQVQNISQTGNAFVVQNVLTEPVTMRFNVGAGQQASVDQVGRPILVDPVWQGNALLVTTCCLAGDLIATTRRYLESPSRMVLELTSPSKSTVKRLFDRRMPGGGFPSMPMYAEQTSQSSVTTSTKDTSSASAAPYSNSRLEEPEAVQAGLLGMTFANGGAGTGRHSSDYHHQGQCDEREAALSVRNERCCLSAELIDCRNT
eukprot:TRINITY_DN2480_c0_g1_i5.p1 TRINITY_DN2480_c0_g1~~TRINITY_DN2480_c0_g1_i5.p1  ORF type:complete len:357 (-),score=54.62 TRINITY_DN2480_c0_g1_i5:329-1399(-)